MARHILAKVLITEAPEAAVIDSSNLSDLTNAVLTGYYIISVIDVNILVWEVSPGNSITTLDLPIGSVIDISYGSNFEITFVLVITSLGVDFNVVAYPTSGGVVLPIDSNTFTLTTGSQNVTLNFNAGGFQFDGIRLKFSTISFPSAIYQISDVLIDNTDPALVYTGFDIGDRIATYCNDSTNLIEVYREDNPGGVEALITDGPPLSGTPPISRYNTTGVIFPRDPTDDVPNGYGSAFTEYNFCNGTTWVRFGVDYLNPVFPYVYKYDYPNSSVCAVNDPDDPVIVCDLQILTTSVITNPSNKYSFDGRVQLYSNNGNSFPTKYGHGSSINTYAELSNTTGLFEGLGEGDTTFIAVDSYGCVSQIFVTLIAGNVPNPDPDNPEEEIISYAAKYQHQYADIHTEQQSVIQILERGYTGVVVFSVGTDEPFVLTKNSGELNNKFYVIRGTSAVFNLISEKHFQYIGLFSQDDRKYKQYFSHLLESFTGWLVASVYNEQYAPNKNYQVSVTSADWLEQLSDEDFVDSGGNNIYANLSLLQIIVIILKKTDLRLNIVSAVNKFAAGMLTGDFYDPLAQTYINTETFYNDGEPQNCRDVLEAILKPFGAFIIQRNSEFWIVETDSQCSPYTYRRVDYLGNYIENGTYDPIVPIVSPSAWIGEPESLEGLLFAEDDHNLDIVPAYGTISVKFNLKPLASIFEHSLEPKTNSWTVNLSSGGTFSSYKIQGKRDKGITFKNLDNIPTPSETSAVIGFYSQPFLISTLKDSVKIDMKYRIKLRNDYIPEVTELIMDEDTLSCLPNYVRIKWKLRLTVASNVFYYSETRNWNQDDNFQENIIYVDSFDDFKTFSIGLNLPTFTTRSEVALQLLFYIEGTWKKDFESTSALRAIDSISKPLGFKLKGATVDSAHLDYYVLTAGTLNSSITQVRPDDYNVSTNAVFWQLTNGDAGGNIFIIQPVDQIQFEDLTVKFLPNGEVPFSTETITYVNNKNYKSSLEVVLDCADLPTSVINHEIYNNIFRLSDGTPTYGWTRKTFSESTTLQTILLKNLGNQYNKPSWRLSGTWLGPNVNFLNIVKHTVAAQELVLLNPSNPESAPWADLGSGLQEPWSLLTGEVSFTSLTPTIYNSKVRRQTIDGLIAGNRIRIDFVAEREAVSDGEYRADRLVCVLLSEDEIVQKVTLCEFSFDESRSIGVSFNIDVNADTIGFMIEQINVPANSVDAVFTVSNFALKGVATVRYYYFDSMDRSDRGNVYRSQIVQLIPAKISLDTDIDDTGGGNTGGDDNGGGTGGGQSGNSFNGAFNSSEFAGSFDTQLN